MPNKLQLIAGAVALAVAHDLGARRIKKQYLKPLALTFDKVVQENDMLTDEMRYLLHVLNENDIALDEFDLIALPHVTVK